MMARINNQVLDQRIGQRESLTSTFNLKNMKLIYFKTPIDKEVKVPKKVKRNPIKKEVYYLELNLESRKSQMKKLLFLETKCVIKVQT